LFTGFFIRLWKKKCALSKTPSKKQKKKMHFTSTSEDFASTFESSNHHHEQKDEVSDGIKLKILLLSKAPQSKSSQSSCFDINTAHLYGSIGYLLVSKRSDDNNEDEGFQEMKREFWLKAIVDCASRFEKITGKKSLVEKQQSSSSTSLKGIEIITDVDASSLSSVDFMEQAMMTNSNNDDDHSSFVSLVVDFTNCEKPSKLDVSSSSFFSTILIPSHGIPLSEITEDRFVFVPFCVIQPKMHRRIPLSSLSGVKEQHAVTGIQLAMEVAQKAGLLGKYGA
jgi:hypothetical protein